MNKFSKEYLFRECILHHHCLLLHLSKSIALDESIVNEVYMTDMCLKEDEKEQLLLNLANSNNTYGVLEIKAYASYESPSEAERILISTNDILEIEFINKYYDYNDL